MMAVNPLPPHLLTAFRWRAFVQQASKAESCSACLRSGRWLMPSDMIRDRVPIKLIFYLSMFVVLLSAGLMAIADSSFLFPPIIGPPLRT